MAELREKFDTAVPDIQEKLAVEAERRKAQREDNDVLRAKLDGFAAQTRQRCATQHMFFSYYGGAVDNQRDTIGAHVSTFDIVVL